MRLMRTLYLVLLIVLPQIIFGQKTYQLEFLNNSYKQFEKRPKTTFKDSTSALKYLDEFQKAAISKGYLVASFDTIFFQNKTIKADFTLGQKLKNVQIKTDPNELKFIQENSSLNEKLISHVPFTPRELALTMRKIEGIYLNHGFPFVTIKLSDFSWNDDELSAKLNVNKGPITKWSKINIRGDSTISAKYISNVIGIKKGDLFSEKETQTIRSRIDQIAFIKEIKPSEILFTKEGAELFLYLESIPISSANGVIGFQPNPTTQKLSLTGEIHLKLLDVFHRGELIDIQWKSIREQTQSLQAKVNYPYLFNTSFGLDGSFNLYKRDTSFLELNSVAGVQYFLKRGNYIKAFYNNISSSVLSGGANNPSFNNLGTVKTNSYGLAYTFKQMDYIPNPTRGYAFEVIGSAGSRKAQVSDTSEINKTTVFRAELTAEIFIPLHRRHVIRIHNSTQLYIADEIYENEVYRYGGLNSQRGFNEDELYATTKTTASLEYRFLLDKNSYAFAFYDQSWYENNSRSYYNDHPFGFGLGFAFSTNFGVFSISYALGKQFSNPILFRNSKVHFGYNVYF